MTSEIVAFRHLAAGSMISDAGDQAALPLKQPKGSFPQASEVVVGHKSERVMRRPCRWTEGVSEFGWLVDVPARRPRATANRQANAYLPVTVTGIKSGFGA
jgi:hypothetical protein